MIKGKNNSGFTLLELLGVMGVIITMSFIVVSSFPNVMGGINDTTGSKGLRDAVQLARQHAMLDNSRVFLIVSGIDSYVMCREGGIISESGSGNVEISYLGDKSVNAYWVYDEWADWESLSEIYTSIYTSDAIEDMIKNTSKDSKFKGLTMYDLDEGKSARVLYPPFVNKSKDLWCLGFHKSNIKSGMFDPGNSYGWVIYEERYLPKGYIFDFDHFDEKEGEFIEGSGDIICFNPDGTLDTSSDFVDELVMGMIDATQAKKIKNKKSIRVDANGTISVVSEEK